MTPLVSFVVPCYKLAHLLPQCVNSILKQTYQEYEILIMDNCSPDDTREVAKSFNDPRVKYIRNERNIGHVRNFNKGIQLAQGKYIWLVSADDWLTSPIALERYAHFMERNPGVGYAFCRAIEVRGAKESGIAAWTDFGQKDRVWRGPKFLMRLIQGNCVVLSAAMVRKECYERFGMFSAEMPHANDWYLCCVLALHYQVGYLADPMVAVRMHEESLTSAYTQGNNPLCIIDELTALWRAAHLAEMAGVISDRRDFNQSITTLAARAMTYGQRGRALPGLSPADFEVLVERYVRDTEDEKDVQARLHMAIADEEFWHDECKKAAQLYRQALRIRPLWLRAWVKYLLLRSGRLGIFTRRFILGLRLSPAATR